MIETVIESIRVNPDTENRVVLLKERHGDRHLPIWIGDFEAQAIAMELQGQSTPRPLPYDLFKTLLGELQGEVERILVTDLSQDVFYAKIVVRAPGKSFEIDARPSDAIAIAVRTGASIFVDESVLDRAGVSLEASGDVSDADLTDPVVRPRDPGASSNEDALSVFRDFINQLEHGDEDKERKSS